MNIKLFYIYKLFKETVPIYPVYLLLFESKGLSLGQISLMLAIWSASVVLLEVPTGILADHWNRRYMLILGGLCKAACYVLWFFSDGFIMFSLGFVFWGISESLCSGSEEALLFDSLKQSKIEHSFDKVYGKGEFFAKCGVALSCFSGGFLSMVVSMRGVLLISVVSTVASVMVAVKFHEVNYFKNDKVEKEESEGISPFKTFADAFSLCLKDKLLLAVILMLIFVIGTAGIMDEYDQLIASSFGLNLGLVGCWIGIRYGLEALGGRIAYHLGALFCKIGVNERFYAISVLCLFAGVFLGISGILNSIIVLPLYGLFYFLMASAGVLQEDFVQQRIKEQGRSTVHSIISLVHNLYGIAFFGLFALLLSDTGIRLGVVAAALYIIILSVGLCLMYSKNKQVKY